MISEDCCKTYKQILESELIEATGCTEPIALALAGAVAKKYLIDMPTHVDVYCSGNMIKNVKGVVVPNSGGLRGIAAAVLLGIIGGDADDVLQVVSKVNDEHREMLKSELEKNYVNCFHQENTPSLYVRIAAGNSAHTVEVELQEKHTNISRIVVDSKEIYNNKTGKRDDHVGPNKDLLNVKDIIEYAETVDIDSVRDLINRQIRDNSAIAEEGLKNNYGASVGKTLLEKSSDVYTRARAMAAAGSDARMNGCPMPVVINSGSGNQGMTLTLPVLEFAKEFNCDEERTIRALVIANLLAIHQKRYIGALSAYCGATSAASAAGGAICWLKGGTYEQICNTLVNSIVTIGGMVCDGAKSSCASKISVAVDSALQSMDMALKNRTFVSGEGLVKDNPEDTIKAVGSMAKEGMYSTDVQILKLMLGKNAE